MRSSVKPFLDRAGFLLARFLLLALAVPLIHEITPVSAQEASIANSRAMHLRHGINLSEWFAQVYDSKGYTKDHLESWTTEQDIALIKSMGFDHVRLSVNPQPMFRRGQADRIPEEYLGYLDAAVKMILTHGHPRHPSGRRL
jgi:endoglucanase